MSRYCKKCVTENAGDSKFCTSCGETLDSEIIIETNKDEVGNNEEVVENTQKSSKGKSVAGFICSLCGILTCGITSIIGLILSIIGLSESKKRGESDGLAVAGIIISSIFIVLMILAGIGMMGSSREIEVVDFSTKTMEEAKEWCDSNNANCHFSENYSSTVPKGKFIIQGIKSGTKVDIFTTIDIVYSKGPKPKTEESDENNSNSNDNSNLNESTTKESAEVSISKKNALKRARSYLNSSAFSRDGLIDQLEFEKYSNEDAVYAVDNCGADWNAQALKKAKSYLNSSAFSYKGLVDQLEFEKFTTEQATYGVDNCGADWNEQAAKKARSYLNSSAFSRDGLIDQLEFEGFTYEQAVYGVTQNGL